MINKLRAGKQRGGNRHPLSVRAFILDHLIAVGEDYGAQIHRAYKAELKKLAEHNPGRVLKGKRRLKVLYYHKTSFASFNKKMSLLAREGLIEFTGREEESDNSMFKDKEWKPFRRYYRITVLGETQRSQLSSPIEKTNGVRATS